MATTEAPRLNPALRQFWAAKRDAAGDRIRLRVLYGGRASSKSWDAAGVIIIMAANVKIRVLCARQFQNKIEESVYSLLKLQIERFGLQDQYKILDNKIVHLRTGSEFLFYGLWRHISEIKSLEGIDICWLEEAHALTAEQWKILEPTLRKDFSQFWVIFNPKFATDFAWRRFVLNPPRGTITRKINYDENPFLSRTMLDVIAAARAEDADEFAHVYLGEPLDNDDAAIIKRAWINAAIDAHVALGIQPAGQWRVGYDIADSGADKCATITAHGSVVHHADLWQGRADELLRSTTRAWHTARQHDAQIIYDSIGVGASAGAQIDVLNAGIRPAAPIAHVGFNAGATVDRPDAIYARAHPPRKNRDMFANAKAQAWWMVADRLRNTYNAVRNGAQFDQADLISIDSSIPHLAALCDELCTPRVDYDPAGRVKVESKSDLAKANRQGGAIPSPNLADAFIMAMGPIRAPFRISSDALAAAARSGR